MYHGHIFLKLEKETKLIRKDIERQDISNLKENSQVELKLI